MKSIERGLAHFWGMLDVHGIIALAGIAGPLILIALDIGAAISQPKYNLIRIQLAER